MSTERDYQKLYDRLLKEVGALHRANQHRIRSGLRALLVVTVGLMLLMFLAGCCLSRRHCSSACWFAAPSWA